MIASALVARTYMHVELIPRAVFVPGGWCLVVVGGHVPALPLLLGILGDVECESFVMNAHGLNSFVLFFCSLCVGLEGTLPPTYAPLSPPPPRLRHSLAAQPPQFIDPRCLFAGLLHCIITKEHCFHAVQMYAGEKTHRRSELQQQQQQHMSEWMLLCAATSVLNEAQGQRQSESQGVLLLQWLAALQMYADKSTGRDLWFGAYLDHLPATALIDCCVPALCRNACIEVYFVIQVTLITSISAEIRAGKGVIHYLINIFYWNGDNDPKRTSSVIRLFVIG